MEEILETIENRLDRIEELLSIFVEQLTGDESVEEWVETQDQEQTL